MAAARAAASRTLRAVKILRTTIERPTSLERAWAAECGGLAGRERSALREICSGSLRYLTKY